MMIQQIKNWIQQDTHIFQADDLEMIYTGIS